jgi:NAD(P)-dependent dehydrogenase (short-subunit alcohol dehydrogenase family)
MNGKICLITGATGGIGKETALGLAQQGATVVIVGRDEAKTTAVVEEIKRASNNPGIHYLIGDLSSQQDVRAVARQFKERFARLDVLVNNAGGVFSGRRTTVDGIEYTFALNHLAYFLLTNELIDLLKQSAPSRIINLSSEAQRGARLDWNNLQGEKHYSSFGQYCFTKLTNIMFTYELDRRLRGSSVTVNAVHPGVVSSGFGTTLGRRLQILYSYIRPFMRSSKKGAETVIYLASSRETAEISGKYYFDKKQIRSQQVSYDESAAKKLWRISEQLIGQA